MRRRVCSENLWAVLLAWLVIVFTASCALEDALSTAWRTGAATLSMLLCKALLADSTPRMTALSALVPSELEG